jgi:transcriptional regulator with XRE-family HTH domain
MSTLAGDFIRAQIKTKKMTSKELASKMKISPAYLSQLLSGEAPLKEDMVNRIVDALELTQDDARKIFNLTRQSINRDTTTGIVTVHEGLPEDILIEWICNARQRIWFLETWIENPIRYKEAFKTASLRNKDNNFEMRILYLSSKSDAARQRSLDLWLVDNTETEDARKIAMIVPQKIELSILEFREIRNRVAPQLEIRVHDSLPYISAYICDEQAFVAFYVHGNYTNLSPTLQVRLSAGNTLTSFGKMLIQEFELLWNRSQSPD